MSEFTSSEERVEALVNAGLALASELNLSTLLQRVADLAREVIGARYAAVGTVDDEGRLLTFVHSGLSEELVQKIGLLPKGIGVLGAIIEEGKPLRLHEIAQHPRAVGFPPHHPAMHTFLGVPIVSRGKVFGRLYMTEKEGRNDFTEDDERVAMLFAAQAGVAVENARLSERLHDMAVFEERDRISRELHDGIIQSIYSVGLSLQSSLGLLERDSERSRERINAAIAELDNVVRDVRSYIFELQPKSVEEKGLSAAIGELAQDVQVNSLAEVSLDLSCLDDLAISRDASIHLIQAVREILSNIVRHSGATLVDISCRREGGTVTFSVQDNGVQFERGAVKEGQGLRNLEERARRLSGTIEIKRRPNGGMSHSLSFLVEQTDD